MVEISFRKLRSIKSSSSIFKRMKYGKCSYKLYVVSKLSMKLKSSTGI